MTGTRGWAALARDAVSRICELAGVAMLTVLAWRMFFDFDPGLETPALVVGLTGLLACLTDRTASKEIPIPLVCYAGAAILSALVSQWSATPQAPEFDWPSRLEAVTHILVMLAFVSGAGHLLRKPARVSAFTAFLFVAIVALAAQIVFDRAAAGFNYSRAGISLPSVPHWSGIHGASFFLNVGLGLGISMVIVERTPARLVGGILLASGFVLVEYLNGSRGGLATMACVIVVALALAKIRNVSRDKRATMVGAAMLLAGVVIAAIVWMLRNQFQSGADLNGRLPIWVASARLWMDYPWLGVGPGNYAEAIAQNGYSHDFQSRYGGAIHNAHNLFMHTAVEIGIVGVVGLIAVLVWALRAANRGWTEGPLKVVSVGAFLALFAFVLHSFSEDFLDARAQVERTRLLFWMLLAAALAISRLPLSVNAHPSR